MEKLFGAVIKGLDDKPFKAKIRDCETLEEAKNAAEELYGKDSVITILEIDEQGKVISQ
jgi:hypothetical protein